MAKTRKEDTYENASAKKKEQIEKEQAVHKELIELESDVVGLWDEYIDVPYGSETVMRIKADLPPRKDKQLAEFMMKAEYASALNVLCIGLYDKVGNLVHKTDSKFFENESNWSVLKVQMLVGALRKHQLEQTNKILSFLEPQS
jgi:hypothetical protein